jgi:hypothetical protein
MHASTADLLDGVEAKVELQDGLVLLRLRCPAERHVGDTQQ